MVLSHASRLAWHSDHFPLPVPVQDCFLHGGIASLYKRTQPNLHTLDLIRILGLQAAGLHRRSGALPSLRPHVLVWNQRLLWQAYDDRWHMALPIYQRGMIQQPWTT